MTQVRIATTRRNPDGSEIAFDERGLIVATMDVLGEKREFAFDNKGKLMVKRFGLWTTPDQARIEADGSLYFRRNDLEVLERLDGVHIQANKQKGVTIKNDQKNKIEVIEQANGEVWKRETLETVEHFWIWKDGVPRFKSDTFFQPVRVNTLTPSGEQPLSYVSRHEVSWERGALEKEKFSFFNEMNNERHVPVALQLGPAGHMLMLRNVANVITKFANDQPVETAYIFGAPTNLRIDIPTLKMTFDAIKEVRSVLTNQGPCAHFRKSDGTDQIIKLA